MFNYVYTFIAVIDEILFMFTFTSESNVIEKPQVVVNAKSKMYIIRHLRK